MKNIRFFFFFFFFFFFLSENFPFLVVKLSICLNRRVFVMICSSGCDDRGTYQFVHLASI